MTKLERRAFVKGLAAAIPLSCVVDGKLKRDMQYEAEALEDGWPVASAAQVGIDPGAIHRVYERFFSEEEYLNGRSFLVARRGVLVGEGYVRDAGDRQRLQHVKSVTKSITSLLAGQALDRGVLPGLDVTLAQVLVEAQERGGQVAEITLEDLITMRSGLDWDNAVHTGELMVQEPGNTVSFTLARPLVRPTGGEPSYADGDPHLLGAAISRQAGKSLEAVARQWLFEPLGILDVKWEDGRDGIDYGAYGAWLRPRDMLKLGELARLGGQWGPQTVVPRAWIDLSSATQVDIDGDPYGYYWWIRGGVADGAYSADGHGGQYIHVLPEQELVCVQTALPYTPTHEHGIVAEETEELISTLIDGLLD